MSPVSVVVDTSVWIEFFRGTGAHELEQLLVDGLVLLPPIVVAELFSAPLRRQEMQGLADALEQLTLHPVPFDHWRSVGQLRAQLARAGISISVPDAHVAQCALETESYLWSFDGIFRTVTKASKLRLFTTK
jgi:predicted nucleic acid-binding protein